MTLSYCIAGMLAALFCPLSSLLPSFPLEPSGVKKVRSFRDAYFRWAQAAR